MIKSKDFIGKTVGEWCKAVYPNPFISTILVNDEFRGVGSKEEHLDAVIKGISSRVLYEGTDESEEWFYLIVEEIKNGQ